jgi:hypothetical protein
VYAYVRTVAGFVAADPAGVYAVTSAGVTTIGRLDSVWSDGDPTLAVNAAGTLVAWFNQSSPTGPQLRTYDPVSGQILDVPIPADGTLGHWWNGRAYWPDAIDGRTVYLHLPDGIYALDLDTLTTQQRLAGTENEVASAVNGQVAFCCNGGNEVLVGPTLQEAHSYDLYGDVTVGPVALSPTGAWLGLTVVGTTVHPVVLDVAHWLPVPVVVPGDAHNVVAVGWLDDRTLEVSATDEDGRVITVYACTVPDGSCTLAARVGPLTGPTLVALPDGRWRSAH